MFEASRPRKGELPRIRLQTYKTVQQAKRAYIKYICKEGLYSPLRDGIRKPMLNPYSADKMWDHGWPVYWATRSYIRDRWERRGDEALSDRAKTEEQKYREAEEERYQDRRRTIRRLVDAELATGWPSWRAMVELGVDVSFTEWGDPNIPVELMPLVEAKQFQMGLTTLINAAKKHRKTHRQ